LVFLSSFPTSVVTVRSPQRSLPAIQEPPSELLFFSPPKTKKKRSAQLDGAEAEEARACAAYLLHVQLIGIDSFPAVFR